MKTHRRASLTCTVQLEINERFPFETPTGPIMVSQVQFGGYTSGTCLVRGPLVKVNGELGYLSREGYAELSVIPREVLEEAIRQLRL